MNMQHVHTNLKTCSTMSRGVLQSYLLGHNFTKTPISSSVRPPADGEEADLISIDDRSSHSSVSEVSEVSSATPRPLNAEGSMSLLPHERWKQSLDNLLNDSEGFTVFKKFLIGRGEERILDCWLAMKGFRDFERPRSSGNSSAASSTTGSLSNKGNQVSEQQYIKKLKLAKAIYKTFLTSNSPRFISLIENATKQCILCQIKAAANGKNAVDIDTNLFVEAQNEIEHNFEVKSYKHFLASDDFVKLSLQPDGSSSRLSCGILSQSTLAQPHKNLEALNSTAAQADTNSSPLYLPRLVEDEVWSPSVKNQAGLAQSHPDNDNSISIDASLKTTSSFSQRPFDEASDAYPYFTPGVIYAVPPASAIGSDQTSKSSDATSDTLSFTDNSSVDGKSYTCTRQGQKRLMRKHIQKNPTNALPECKEHVQRTSRMNDIPNLATKNPALFFEQLKVKLQRVLEEQRMQQKHVSASFKKPLSKISDPMPSIKNEEEDMEKFLESHLNRVIQSPPGRHSPVMKVKHERHSGSNGQVSQPNPPPPGFGVVPGMARNEVPDIATPVIPVDKNRMISAWIQTPEARQTKLKKNRSSLPAESPSGDHYVHPADSTGLQSGVRAKKMQLLNQDPNMPLLDQPDAVTTIEEVKRRLMEETDRSYEMPMLDSLKLASIPPPNQILPVSSTSVSWAKPHPAPTSSSTSLVQDPVVDSDTSSETTTLCNVNSSTEHAQPATTTVVYYMPHDKVPYRIKMPHCPVTLGQFKNALSRKGDFRYYFRHYSVDLQRPAFFEISNDGELLPKYEGNVLAKVELNRV